MPDPAMMHDSHDKCMLHHVVVVDVVSVTLSEEKKSPFLVSPSLSFFWLTFASW